ncbi:MAG: cupin domain-containing protein [Myxococcales bacterium]
MAPGTGLCIDRCGGEPPTALEMEQRLRAEGFRPYRCSHPPGTAQPARGAREVRWLLSGKLRVRLAGSGEAIVLSPGDRLDLPPGLVHEIVALGDEPAVLVAAEGEPALH